jgi:hypothetical protein
LYAQCPGGNFIALWNAPLEEFYVSVPVPVFVENIEIDVLADAMMRGDET